MSRATRKPMSHLNLVRDELGKLRRPENF
nr:hypothetical protein [uncultured Enterobacter sp.]